MNPDNVFTPKPYKIGFALSGGGIKGLCHAGALKALEESGIKPHILSGVSAGAVVGALYADGYSPDEIAKLFEDITLRNMTKMHVPDGGFFKMDVFQNFLFRKLRAKTFEELAIPLRVVATDLDKGQSVVFSSGNLIDPIVASCCLPVLFSPQLIGGVHYVDGGVLKNFPVSTIRKDCEKVIGINASLKVADEFKLSILNVVSRTYELMFKANILHDKELCDLLIEPLDMGRFATFDSEKGHEIFELGYKSTKKSLKGKLEEKII
ncbi:MAG: patatin-like phospholipase family protein [Paludibacter sp.]